MSGTMLKSVAPVKKVLKPVTNKEEATIRIKCKNNMIEFLDKGELKPVKDINKAIAPISKSKLLLRLIKSKIIKNTPKELDPAMLGLFVEQCSLFKR